MSCQPELHTLERKCTEQIARSLRPLVNVQRVLNAGLCLEKCLEKLISEYFTVEVYVRNKKIIKTPDYSVLYCRSL